MVNLAHLRRHVLSLHYTMAAYSKPILIAQNPAGGGTRKRGAVCNYKLVPSAKEFASGINARARLRGYVNQLVIDNELIFGSYSSKNNGLCKMKQVEIQ